LWRHTSHDLALALLYTYFLSVHLAWIDSCDRDGTQRRRRENERGNRAGEPHVRAVVDLDLVSGWCMSLPVFRGLSLDTAVPTYRTPPFSTHVGVIVIRDFRCLHVLLPPGWRYVAFQHSEVSVNIPHRSHARCRAAFALASCRCRAHTHPSIISISRAKQMRHLRQAAAP
jgi:hypothetical protein